jgi:type II secretory pathway component PulF
MKLVYRIEAMNSSGEDEIINSLIVDIFKGESIEKKIFDKGYFEPKIIFKYQETFDLNIKSLFTSSNISISDEELFEFLSGYYDALETEMGQLEMFQFLRKLFTSKKMISLIDDISEQVALNGKPLFLVLEEKKFPNFVTSALEVGSESGNNLLVVKKLLELIETKIETKKKVKKMMREPKIVGTFLTGYFFFTMFYFIPASMPLLKFSDPKTWPEITKTLIGWSEYAHESSFVFVISTFIILGVSVKILLMVINFIGQFIPFIKNITANQETSLLFSVLTVAAYSDVMLNKAVRQASGIIENKKMQQDLLDISENIELGERFSSQLRKFNFNEKLVILVEAGEESNKASSSYEKIAKKYKELTDESIEKAIDFIKPITLVFAAGTLITIYYGVNAPLLNFGSIG